MTENYIYLKSRFARKGMFTYEYCIDVKAINNVIVTFFVDKSLCVKHGEHMFVRTTFVDRVDENIVRVYLPGDGHSCNPLIAVNRENLYALKEIEM